MCTGILWPRGVFITVNCACRTACVQPWWARLKADWLILQPSALRCVGYVMFSGGSFVRPATRNDLSQWNRPFVRPATRNDLSQWNRPFVRPATRNDLSQWNRPFVRPATRNDLSQWNRPLIREHMPNIFTSKFSKYRANKVEIFCHI
jgi:hypothetical protein